MYESVHVLAYSNSLLLEIMQHELGEDVPADIAPAVVSTLSTAATVTLRSPPETFSPISHLPNELLAMMFDFYLKDHFLSPAIQSDWYSKWRRAAAASKDVSSTLGGISIHLVCRHWYNVMATCPVLWTHMTLRTPEIFDTMLQRSGCLPLYVENIHTPGKMRHDKDHVQALVSLFKQLNRVRSLDLVVSPDVQNALKKVTMPPQDGRSLESLILAFPSQALYNFTQWGPIGLGSDMPRLKRLSVNYIDYGFLRNIVRPTLTTLEINYHYPGQTVAAWLDLLSGLPALQELQLVNFQLKSAPDDTVNATTPRTLCFPTGFRRLVLDASIHHRESVSQLLDKIKYERLALVVRIHDSFLEPSSDFARYGELRDLLGRLLHQDHIYRVTIRSRDVGRLVLTHFASYRHVNLHHTSGLGQGSLLFSLRLAKAAVEATKDGCLPPILEEFAPVLTRAHQLLHMDVKIPCHIWTAFRRWLPQMRRIQVSHASAVRTFLDAVKSASAAGLPLPFPHLIYLVVAVLAPSERLERRIIEDWQEYSDARCRGGLAGCSLKRALAD